MRELVFLEDRKNWDAFGQFYNSYNGNAMVLLDNGMFLLTNSILKRDFRNAQTPFGFSIRKGTNLKLLRLVDENGDKLLLSSIRKSNPYATFIYDHDTGTIAKLHAIYQNYNTGEPVSSLPFPKPRQSSLAIVGLYPSFESKPLTGAPINYKRVDRLRQRKFAKELELLRSIAAAVKALNYPNYTNHCKTYTLPYNFNPADTDAFAEYCGSLNSYYLTALANAEHFFFEHSFPYVYVKR